MSALFLRTVSQGIQGFMPIAVALAWWRHVGERRRSAAIHVGVLLSIPVTVVASWWFQADRQRALDEAALAFVAVIVAGWFGVGMNRNDPVGARSHAAQTSWWSVSAVVVAAMLVVVRQTMEIGAVLAAALFQVRSLDATVTILEAVLASLAIAALWLWVGRRISSVALARATHAFTVMFFLQAVVYVFHESTEARLLPWSDVLHPATEPYGPDGVYGMHLSDLLVVVPFAAAGWASVRLRVLPARIAAWRVATARPLIAGTLIGVSFAFMGVQRNDALAPRPIPAATAAEIAAVTTQPHVLFRDTSPGPRFGRLSVAALAALDKRLPVAMTCQRVSFAADHGLCLHTERGVFDTHTAVLLDRDLRPGVSIKLAGLPSRTRTAADGRVAGITVFVLGDDYASDSFSTRTTIVDLSSGDEIGELEQFATWRNGARLRAADFNFWGLTFSRDAGTFYASLRTARTTYLVRGELALRRLTAVRENVECPSLSPDGRLLAYKKRVGPSPDAWRLHVLDLETNVEQILTSETRYINDQVEWLDSQHVLYSVPRRTTAISDVFVAPIDGSAPSRIFLPEAESPIVVR